MYNGKLVKIVFSRNTQKHVLWDITLNQYRLQNPPFLWETFFGGTKHPCRNNEATLDLVFGGGGRWGELLGHSL